MSYPKRWLFFVRATIFALYYVGLHNADEDNDGRKNDTRRTRD